MNNLYFNFNNTLIDWPVIDKLYIKLRPEVLSLNDMLVNYTLKEGYNTDYASFFLPYDNAYLEYIKQTALNALKLEPSLIILIGIGGSYLGTMALFKALYGSYYNDSNYSSSNSLKFYALDTLEENDLEEILKIAEKVLCEGKNILILIATKSGTTTETIANAAFFISLLKKYKHERYKNYIYTITNKDSMLYKLACDKDFNVITVPTKVGGRFSVLSAIGLFPLALLGVDIKNIVRGACDMQKHCRSSDIKINYAAYSALTLYYHYKYAEDKKNIHDTFLFSTLLSDLGSWYRQLVGESLGKKYSKYNSLIYTGITPTISIGTADLHSVVQLYLGGPRDKITTFVKYKSLESYGFPDTDLKELLPGIKGQSIGKVKDAIFEGVLQAYKEEKRPFTVIEIPYKSAYGLGQFLMMKMFEVVYLAYLLDANPFDQPEVELYKTKTRAILSQARY